MIIVCRVAIAPIQSRVVIVVTFVVEQKINEALKTKQGTLRIKRSPPNESQAQPPAKAPANYADAVQTILSIQDDSLELVLKDPIATKVTIG
jgi:hypothetical protein